MAQTLEEKVNSQVDSFLSEDLFIPDELIPEEAIDVSLARCKKLWKIHVSPGNADKPVIVKPSMIAQVYYKAWLATDPEKKIIDKSQRYKGDQDPLGFTVGHGSMMKALDEGVRSMTHKGEKALFLSHFDYAYGRQSEQKRETRNVPNMSIICFEVSLVDAFFPTGCKKDELEDEEVKFVDPYMITFSQRIKLCEELLLQSQELISNNNFDAGARKLNRVKAYLILSEPTKYIKKITDKEEITINYLIFILCGLYGKLYGNVSENLYSVNEALSNWDLAVNLEGSKGVCWDWIGSSYFKRAQLWWSVKQFECALSDFNNCLRCMNQYMMQAESERYNQFKNWPCVIKEKTIVDAKCLKELYEKFQKKYRNMRKQAKDILKEEEAKQNNDNIGLNKCTMCNKCYSVNKSLIRHLKEVHKIEAPYVCTHVGCREKFAFDNDRRNHVAQVHNEENAEVDKENRDNKGHTIISGSFATVYLQSVKSSTPNQLSRIVRDFHGICDLTDKNFIDYQNFVVYISPKYGIPVAAFESLSSKDFLGPGERYSRVELRDFHCDTSYTGKQSKPTAYSKSGFQRGHLAAFHNHSNDLYGCIRTMLMTNAVPMTQQVNGGPMNQLEKHIRALVVSHGRVLVMTFAIFFDNAKLKYLDVAKTTAIPNAIGKMFIYYAKDALEVKSYVIQNSNTPKSLKDSIVTSSELLANVKLRITLPSPKSKHVAFTETSMPKYSLDMRDINFKEIKRRYPNLFVPCDFFLAKSTWMDTFPLHTPFELGHPCSVHIFKKGVRKIEIVNRDGLPNILTDIPEVLEPDDASSVFKAKVIIPSMSTLEDMFRKASGAVEDSQERPGTPQHVDRLIDFIVGVKTLENGVMALGGPWSPSLDGLNPHSDPQTLINTAIRCARALAGINLSRCKHWYRFMELYYKRNNCLETVVFFLPDVWSCLPEAKEWTKLNSLYKYAVYGENPNLMGKDSGGTKDTSTKDRLSQTVSAAYTPSAKYDGISKDSAGAQSGKLDISKLSPPKTVNPKALNVVQLRKQLNLRNLSTEGLKAQLIDRLTVALKKENEESKESNPTEVNEDNNGSQPVEVNKEDINTTEKEPNSANAESVIYQLKDEIDKNVQSSRKKMIVNETKKQVKELRIKNDIQSLVNVDVSIDNENLKQETDVNTYQQLQEFNQTLSMFPQNTFPIIKPGMKAEEIKKWKRRYALPNNPKLLVYPSRFAKGGNFDCISMSLGQLRNYDVTDQNEDRFEVSLFSEFFHEMLQRDFAFRIYREMVSECVRTDTGELMATEKEIEKNETSDKENDAAHFSYNRMKLSKTSSATAARKRISDPYLLLSCIFFDVTRCGYFTETELEDLCYSIGIGLTCAQVRNVVSKVVYNGNLNYRKWTTKPVKRKAESDDETRILAQGNMAHFPVFILQNKTPIFKLHTPNSKIFLHSPNRG